jgi:hypothetical protein
MVLWKNVYQNNCPFATITHILFVGIIASLSEFPRLIPCLKIICYNHIWLTAIVGWETCNYSSYNIAMIK